MIDLIGIAGLVASLIALALGLTALPGKMTSDSDGIPNQTTGWHHAGRED